MQAKSKIKVARTSSTLYVYDSSTQSRVEKALKRALLDGESVHHADGSREWISDEVITDTTKSGSECFTWAADGNRVKHERCRYTLRKDGVLEKVVLKTVFRVMD
jgi:hypothetical protein